MVKQSVSAFKNGDHWLIDAQWQTVWRIQTACLVNIRKEKKRKEKIRKEKTGTKLWNPVSMTEQTYRLIIVIFLFLECTSYLHVK